MAEAAPARFMLSGAWVLIKVLANSYPGRPHSRVTRQRGCCGDLDFGGEGRVVHRYYTSNKTRPLLGEQRGVLTGVGGGHHNEDIAGVVRWHVWDGVRYPDGEAAADVSSGHSCCRLGSTSKMLSTGGRVALRQKWVARR